MSLQTAMRTLSKRMVDRFGAEFTIAQPGTSTYDAVSGESTPGDTRSTVRGVIERWSSADSDDVRIILAAKDTARPEKGWRVIHGAKVYEVVDVEVSQAGTTDVVYEVRGRERRT